MSIPLFFQAIERNGNLYVDGGVLDNFPIYIFDADPFDPKEALRAPVNSDTLGLKLESDNEKLIESDEVPPAINSMKDYVSCLLECVLGHIAELKVKPNDERRTVTINSRYVSAIDFEISDNEKNLLIHEGRKAVETFFNVQPPPRDYVGYLIVNLIELKNVLMKVTALDLPFDPYCILRTENSSGAVLESQKSSTKRLAANPVWNKRYCFKIKSVSDTFTVEIRDSTMIGKDRVFGAVSVPVKDVMGFTFEDRAFWYPISHSKATMHLSFCFSPA
eukprot:Phypoly_transcript_15176.p1 GENE.Phypoly_transcript_15176~~Phypoly_transcript_15176.p1  ORF type:complete len:291 (+),score=29.52 Phypoly_transcript_15176:47-874(+)